RGHRQRGRLERREQLRPRLLRDEARLAPHLAPARVERGPRAIEADREGKARPPDLRGQRERSVEGLERLVPALLPGERVAEVAARVALDDAVAHLLAGAHRLAQRRLRLLVRADSVVGVRQVALRARGPPQIADLAEAGDALLVGGLALAEVAHRGHELPA